MIVLCDSLIGMETLEQTEKRGATMPLQEGVGGWDHFTCYA